MAMILAASMTEPPPRATTKSQPLSRAKRPPSSTTDFRGLAPTLSNSTVSTPAMDSCSRVRSRAPLSRVDLPLEMTTMAFLPGRSCSCRWFSWPAPKRTRVGTKNW